MLSHFSGALLAALGLFVLLRRATARELPLRARVTLGTYAVSLIFTFAASALFHYFPWRPVELVFFKKLDHAAIFVLIAGTCTVLLNAGGRKHRNALIVACWTISLTALVLKMIYWPMALWMTASVYLSVGWVAAISVLHAMRHVPWDNLRLLVYGMAVYTAAAVVFATEAPIIWPGMVEGHELFHIMVLVGAGTHYVFVHRFCTIRGALRGNAADGACGRVSLVADRQGS